MKSIIVSLIGGLLFGVGLVVSGMTQPAKVAAFLDFSGAWDPSLAFVMAGAIGVHAAVSRFVRRRAAPLFERSFSIPTREDIDGRLLLGAGVFGVGWGLGGYCPGPALTSLASGDMGAVVFVAAMVTGMLLQHLLVTARPHEDGLPAPEALAASSPHGAELR